MGWQPIETAPKDGTWVLLTGGTVDGSWDGDTAPMVVVGQYLPPWGSEAIWHFAWYDNGYYGEYSNPTHWMPLPEPPKGE